MWYEERTEKSYRPRLPKFNLCCRNGLVQLPLLKKALNFLIQLLDYNGSLCSKLFRQNIRAYNSMFAFTLTGGKVDHTVNDGHGPYVYRLNGLNHHKIGFLLPVEGRPPKFTQLYIYDTENEVSNRLNVMGANGRESDLDRSVVEGLIHMLEEHNPLAKVFRMARERFNVDEIRSVKIRLIGNRSKDGAQYNIPTASEVAAIVVGDGNQPSEGRDIVVDQYGVGLRRIIEIHPSFMAMQYPLLFPYGEDFYRKDINYNIGVGDERKRKSLTFRDTLAFRIQ